MTKVGFDLVRLHSQRVRADYQLDATDIETLIAAQSTSSAAQQVIQVLDAAFRSPQRAQIQSAITKWRRENGYP